MTETLVRGDDGDNDDRRRFLADLRALAEQHKTALIEALKDEQHRRCVYGTREGDNRTCDCKFRPPYWQSEHYRPGDEQSGCPELRAAIWVLEATG